MTFRVPLEDVLSVKETDLDHLEIKLKAPRPTLNFMTGESTLWEETFDLV
jgi:hypothetical protein